MSLVLAEHLARSLVPERQPRPAGDLAGARLLAACRSRRRVEAAGQRARGVVR